MSATAYEIRSHWRYAQIWAYPCLGSRHGARSRLVMKKFQSFNCGTVSLSVYRYRVCCTAQQIAATPYAQHRPFVRISDDEPDLDHPPPSGIFPEFGEYPSVRISVGRGVIAQPPTGDMPMVRRIWRAKRSGGDGQTFLENTQKPPSGSRIVTSQTKFVRLVWRGALPRCPPSG